MNKKKILFLCSWYPNKFKPTLGNFVQKHAEAVSIFNETVVLAVFPSSSITKTEITESSRTNLSEIIVYYPKASKGIKLFRIIKNFRAHRKAFKMGYELVKEKIGTPEVVHLNVTYPLGIWALWMKWRKKIPYVISEHSSGFHIQSNHSYPKKILFLCRLILRNSAVLLPVSENLKNNLKLLSPKSRFSIIPNVVDEHLFIPKESENKDFVKLIHISTGIDEIKNISGMIRVFEKIKQANLSVTLDIVSDGDTKYAEDLTSSFELNDLVFFHSIKTTSEIARMIQESDALLMFSNYENFPCVIAESMMCGKPVITSDVNGIPEHVYSLNGILVKPKDEIALFEAIKRFIIVKNDFDSTEIRKYALEHFSYNEVGKKFSQIYDKVLIEY
jgi:glycosyltransferase involved in cell wall biosynthesis